MTIKIELSDAVLEYVGKKLAMHEGYSDDWWNNLPPSTGLDTMYKEKANIAITAALEAMVKEGTACFAPCEINSDEDGDFWNANEGWKTGDFPALIIRLGGKP